MGLFDFLKKKPAAPEPTPAAAPADAAAPAKPTPTGPRYKGSNYTLPVEETPAAPMLPPLMPPMPQAAPEAPVPFPYQPSNVLEELLMRAAQEPAVRPAFYQALVNEELFAVTLVQEGAPGGEVPLTPGMEVQLQVLHDGKIPLFSSPERIFEGGVAPENAAYIRVRGFDLLQMVQAADCVLNPFSPAGKLLASQEIQDLLAGNLFPPAADGPDGGQVPVQLAQPAEEVVAPLVAALREFAAGKPFIEQAYVAEMRIENSAEPPRLLLSFQTPDNQDPAFLQELGPIIEGRLEGYQFVDMMLLTPAGAQEPLNQYFAQQAPYFKR